MLLQTLTGAQGGGHLLLVNNIKISGGTSCPWGVWAGRFLATAFALIFICVVFDRDAEKLLKALSWITLAGAAATDAWGRRFRRLLQVLGAWLMVLTTSGVSAWFAGDFPAAVHGFVKYQIGVVWFAVLWLAAPIVPPLLTRHRMGGYGYWNINRWAAMVVALLLMFAFHATLSAGASLFPKDSMELLGAEILPYTGLFIIIVRCAYCIDNIWARLGARWVWCLLVLTCIGMAVTTILALASPGLEAGLLRQGYFRIDQQAPDTPRLQFLFHHHNRAGFFAACAIFLCLAGAWGGAIWRTVGITGAAAAAFALPFTLTRGALMAAGAGMVLFSIAGLARHRRGRWALVVGALAALPLLWLTLPDSYRGHIAKALNPDSYHAESEGSIGARLIIWDTAVSMIKARPLLGFGYGFENFESAARLDHPELPNYFKDAVHAHNHWLETAAETGLPGLALLLLFTLLRIGGLAVAWWRGMRSGYGFAWILLLWLCLECVIQLYGLANYTLRRNLGFLTYWIWAGSVALVLMAARAEEIKRAARWDSPQLDHD